MHSSMEPPRHIPKGARCIEPNELNDYIKSELDKKIQLHSNAHNNNLFKNGQAASISRVAIDSFDSAQFYRPVSRGLTLLEDMKTRDPYFFDLWQKYEADRAIKEESERIKEALELESLLESYKHPTSTAEIASDVIKILGKSHSNSQLQLPDPWLDSKKGVKIDPPSPNLKRCYVNGRFLGVNTSEGAPPVGSYQLSKYGETGKFRQFLSTHPKPIAHIIPKSETSPSEIFEKKIMQELASVPGPGSYKGHVDRWASLNNPLRDRRIQLGIVKPPAGYPTPPRILQKQRFLQSLEKDSSKGLDVDENGVLVSLRADFLKRIIPPEFDSDPDTLSYVTERVIAAFAGDGDREALLTANRVSNLPINAKSKSAPSLRKVLDSTKNSQLHKNSFIKKRPPLLNTLDETKQINMENNVTAATHSSTKLPVLSPKIPLADEIPGEHRERRVFNVPESELALYGRKDLLISEYASITGRGVSTGHSKKRG